MPVACSSLFINKSVTFLILTITALDGYARTNQGEGEGRGGGAANKLHAILPKFRCHCLLVTTN